MRLVYSQEELQALSTALAEVLQACRDRDLDRPRDGLCGNVDYHMVQVGLDYAGLGYDFMDTVFDLWPHSLRQRASDGGEDQEAQAYPIPHDGYCGKYEGPNLAYRVNAMEFAVKLCAAMLAAYDLGEHDAVQER